MATLESKLKLSLFDGVTGPIRRVGAAVTAFQSQMRAMAAPFTGFTARMVGLGAGYLGATAGIDGTIGAARDMQSALTEIGIKADLSGGQLAQLRQQMAALAPRTNQTTSDLLAGIDAMVTLGLGAQDAAAAMPAIGRAATASKSDIADLAAASVAAMQNLKVAPTEITKMLDSMTAAGNAGAFELRDMASAFPQLTASAQALGMKGTSAVTDLAAALQIARRGAGDASTAANNLSNFTGKLMAPETIKNFKKFGVDATKELKKAHRLGVSPIEHFIKLVDEKTKGGQADLLGQLFGDKQVLDFVRPMLSDFRDYVRIRDEAERASGTAADAYARRMEDANEKLKAFRIQVQNLGTAFGGQALGPLGDAAQYLANVLDTLDQRVTVFDRIGGALKGFTAGLGFEGDTIADSLKQLREFIFGHADASAAADEYGKIFKKFHEWGQAVGSFTKVIADNPIGKFLGEMSGYGFRLMVAAAGISIMAGAVRKLAAAVALLTGISTAASIIKALAGAGGLLTKATPKTPTAPALPVLPFIAKALPWLTLPFVSGDTPSDWREGEDTRMDSWTRDWWRMQGWERGGPNTRGRRDRGEVEREQSLDGWLDGPATRAPLPQVQGGLTIEDLRSAVVKTEPTGVARVEVTNGMRPNVTINQSNVFNNIAEPERVAGQIGGAVKAQVEASYSDGGL